MKVPEMSISWGAQYPKLKTNLRLAINRLQLLGKKKTEMAMKARTEIAEYIGLNKPDRARIRVEHIIREDYVVEAFEILEMYCDLLLARFGLIEQMKTLDDGIAEAVISVMWAAPRLATDIAEFKTISDQLTVKYGKPFAEAARANQLEFPAKVNPKLVAKLSAAAPPKLLVERYLIEIAAAAQIAFTPDPDVMREDEVHQAEQILIDFKNAGGPGAAGGPPSPPSNNPYGGGGVPPPPPSNGGGSGYGWSYDGTPVQQPPGHPIGAGVVPVPYMQPKDDENIYDIPSTPGNIYEVPARDNYDYPPDAFNQSHVINPGVINLPKIGPNGLPIYSNNPPPSVPPTDKAYPPLSQRNSLIQPTIPPNHPTAPPQSIRKPDNLDDLAFPEPPKTFIGGPKPGGGGGSGASGPPGGGSDGGSGGDLDFDDLAKRFDALKKRNN